MLKLHTKLEDKLLDLESRSRRENIRIYGVPEGSEKESTMMVSFVENLLREGLELTHDMPDLQIERAYRSLGPQPLGDTRHAPRFKNKRDNTPQSMAEEGVYLARKLHKSRSRLSTSNTQEKKRIHRDPQNTEGKQSSVPDPLPCQAARETRGRNQNLRDCRGDIRGPAEKRLCCDNHHHTSGDAHGTGAAALLDESGRTSKEGHNRPGSELQEGAPSLQEIITDPLWDWKDLTHARGRRGKL